MPGVNELIELGFKKVGYWEANEANDKLPNGIKLVINDEAYTKNNGIYAYVQKPNNPLIQEEKPVKYIGMAFRRTLYQRMLRYQIEKREGFTSNRVPKNIANALKDSAVHIFVFVPNEKLMYRKVTVNLITGLEPTLIQCYDPEWNKSK